MFESQDQGCVFMEAHMNPSSCHEMVPLPRQMGDMAPIYFKNSIADCDEEWEMNKKLVDFSSKDIRHDVSYTSIFSCLSLFLIPEICWIK
uniref:Uncharacterized protein n=1 Tax=Salmo trutta TaxID=8032 RepID=A0A673XVX1_SALTR